MSGKTIKAEAGAESKSQQTRKPTSVFSPEYELFLRLFQEARKQQHLSQYDVAERLNKPQSYLSKCQTGERRVDVIELFNYCEAIGVPFTEFAKTLEQAIKRGHQDSD